ncbi:PTS glucose/sucrose transporter subunit IIB [uncultured Megasphaera sp.]|uniref:PTS glucose/sucrose transporter subunit IIB n=1 Tax=uncultured Megasphaera sp. TaxID=165188 RepID=UPI00258ACDF6|nr:PTS glucose/sucrose transporter subunit IIB [uncultured Megasphaera sp.]
MDYDKLARDIYNLTGPSENIQKSYNCMTRLRLTVTNEHFTKEDLAKLPGVMGVNRSGDEWQIIVGPGKATKLYQAFAKIVDDDSNSKPSAKSLQKEVRKAPLTAKPCTKKSDRKMRPRPNRP